MKSVGKLGKWILWVPGNRDSYIHGAPGNHTSFLPAINPSERLHIFPITPLFNPSRFILFAHFLYTWFSSHHFSA